MKIENAKTNIKIEKAYRLGRKKDGATRPRPIVVKFGSYVEREMVRNLSKRLKGTNFGISPHYPPEVLEKRKKLIPVMLKERQENKKAYIVGDKLFVNGTLWKEQESAESDINESGSVKSVLKVCSWNISKGIIRKLADGEFLKSVCENDIICFNECWVKCPKEFELNGYGKKYVKRKM